MATKTTTKTEEKKGGLGRYFRGVKSEFKKVVWPTKDTVIKYSIIVIVAVILSSLLLLAYDKIIMFLFGFIYWLECFSWIHKNLIVMKLQNGM